MQIEGLTAVDYIDTGMGFGKAKIMPSGIRDLKWKIRLEMKWKLRVFRAALLMVDLFGICRV